MMRPAYTWLVFGLCLAVLIAAMGWVSMAALRLDRSEALARRQAEVEENVRLSLWRMESAVAPLIAQESGRPLETYDPYGSVLAQVPDKVLLHFQINADGRLTSPQALPPSARGGVLTSTEPAIAQRLGEMQGALRFAELAERLPVPLPASLQIAAIPPQRQVQAAGPQPRPMQVTTQQQDGQQVVALQSPEAQQEFVVPQAQEPQAARQQAKSSNEFRFREQNISQIAFANGSFESPAGPMKALWVGDRLLLARRVVFRGQEEIQGCWLDWPALKKSLLGGVADLLPHAELVPASATARSTRMLAALPVELAPGELFSEGSNGFSPLRLSLIVAWIGVLLAAAAVAVLMRVALVLSERRGAFVSAVTHELRTPLTTFRMYTDMLTAGMVPDETKRRRYLETLREQADRLSHLVENVLIYARLEQGRPARRPEVLRLADLLTRASPRLRERAEAAEMELAFGAIPEHAWVRADPSAVEQILFNLVDNACKYAAAAEDRRIHIDTACAGAAWGICVRDGGPGISRRDARRLFRPFSKSSQQAANSKPGVGLGLALSRRLARAMGGDLALGLSGPGCAFVLTLPKADAAPADTAEAASTSDHQAR